MWRRRNVFTIRKINALTSNLVPVDYMVTEAQMKSQSEHTSILHMGSMTISTRSSSDRHCHAAVGLPEHYANHLYILPIMRLWPGSRRREWPGTDVVRALDKNKNKDR